MATSTLLNLNLQSMFTPAPPGLTVREISLHVNKNTVSHAVHTPTSLPMQWQESAKTQLDNVAAMTIREKIPIGKSSRWCHRMVITFKSDTSLRRTVDLSPLNT